MGEPRVLVIGYGNPARGDDGVGPALAARLEALGLPGVTVEADYQLCIEHAALAAEHDIVIFADAATDAAGPFYVRPLEGDASASFCSHAATPAQVVHLARSCFDAAPRSYLLGIRARAIEGFEETLSAEARAGLDAALAHLVAWLTRQRAGELPATGERRCETAST